VAFANQCVEIRLGNVESRIVGPAPRQALDRALNPHLTRTGGGDEPGSTALVYRASSDTFLTGALPDVKRTLRRCGCRFRIRDLRWSRRRRADWRLQGVQLREYQREAVELALEHGHGLIDLATGGGKTLLAAACIAEVGLPTLYLVTTRTLMQQTVDSLRRLLGVEPGIVGQGTRAPDRLTVALVQSLDTDRVDLRPFQGGTLVFDEGHHAAATSWSDLIRRIGPYYHWYLSAVPWRAGGDQKVLDALAGPRLTDGRFSAAFLIENGFACPIEVRVERCRIAGEMAEKTFASLYREFVVCNPARNAAIARIAGLEAAAGDSVLVLVDHVRHGRELMALLGERAVFVSGVTARSDLHDATERFRDGELRLLVATAGLFAEGVSIDGINVLVQGGGLKSRAKVIQAVGRGMRRAPGKRCCVYVDFYDDDEAGVFRAHSLERLAVLKELGFDVPPVPAPEVPPRVTDVHPTWAHVPETRAFVLVDGSGRVRGQGLCLRKALVPEGFCEQCETDWVCKRGGRIEWRDDRE